jgi:hypothetical protein
MSNPREDELEISWLNGNRKFVVKEVKDDPLLTLKIFDRLSLTDKHVFLILVEALCYA